MIERTPKMQQVNGFWEPWIEIGERTIYLGRYKSKGEAAKAYHRRWRRERLNFIKQVVNSTRAKKCQNDAQSI